MWFQVFIRQNLKKLTLIQIPKRKFDFNTNYKYIKRD